jgi:hypothetical protein
MPLLSTFDFWVWASVGESNTTSYQSTILISGTLIKLYIIVCSKLEFGPFGLDFLTSRLTYYGHNTLSHVILFSKCLLQSMVGYRCSQSYWCGSIAGQEKLMCVSLGPHTTHVCKLPVPFYSGQHSFFQAHSDGERCNQGLYAIVAGLERSIEFGPE